tara:strand:+ start:2616 stop:2870 length:255 start_codon:yes stop_codon:yes gene_type:complete
MFKGFAAAQSRYENAIPEDNECDHCVAGECGFHEVYEIANRLENLGYDSEVVEDVGVTVIKNGAIKMHGTEEEVLEWLDEKGEL